jgi:hypothetical protein
MGRHVLPFKLQANIDWNKLEANRLRDFKGEESKGTIEATATSNMWMLPSTNWEHSEDVAVYTGTARSAHVKVQYILECSSLCAVRGSVDHVVASKEVNIRGSIDPSSLHSPSLMGSYSPLGGTNETITLRAKLNRRTYSHGDSIDIQYEIKNNFSEPVKEVTFSLLNSAMIREPGELLPALHTASVSSASHTSLIDPNSALKSRISLAVPPSTVSRWFNVTKEGTKVSIEPLIRISISLANFQPHIFQSTLSVSPKARPLHGEKTPTETPAEDPSELSSPDSSPILTTSPVALSSNTSATLPILAEPASASIVDPSALYRSTARTILWVKDSEAAKCAHCTGVFSLFYRRHHCRGCGLLVCSNHSKSMPAPKLFGDKPRRVCKTCEILISSGQLTSNLEIITSSGQVIDPDLPVVRINEVFEATIHQELESTSVSTEPIDLGGLSYCQRDTSTDDDEDQLAYKIPASVPPATALASSPPNMGLLASKTKRR